MKFSITILAGFAATGLSTPASKQVYSVNSLTTSNGQINQPWSVNFDVGASSKGKAITHCSGSVPWNPGFPNNNTVSGKTYACNDKTFTFVYTIGNSTQKSTLKLSHTPKASKGVKGSVAFPTPKCEITPGWYVCPAAQNYTIALQ